MSEVQPFSREELKNWNNGYLPIVDSSQHDARSGH